jgi:hypothetical protein
MKILYIILAHKEPSQVIKLVETLIANEHYVIIHYNKLSSNEEFAVLRNRFENNLHVFFLDRMKTAWGHFSLMEVIINSLKKAASLDIKYDHAIILSGQDYPIKSNTEIKRFLASHPQKIFYRHFEITPDMGDNKPYVHPVNDRVTTRPQHHRVDSYYWRLNSRKYLLLPGEPNPGATSLRVRVSNKIKFLLSKVVKRKFPDGFRPYFGATFGIITFEFAEYLINFYAQHPAFNKYMQYAFCADEMYLVTAAMNHPYFASKMVNNNLIYSKWSEEGGLHPVLLSAQNIEELQHSSMLFARKFDTKVDASILEIVDEKLLLTPGFTTPIDTTKN